MIGWGQARHAKECVGRLTGGISSGLVVLLLAGCAARPTRVAVTAVPDETPATRLAHVIDTVTSMPGVARGTWGIVVESLPDRTPLARRHPEALLVPASTAKLLTLAVAAEAVGWDYRFDTSLFTTGPIVDGVLRGDLVVVGSGDPSIGGRGGDDLGDLIDAVTARGIRRVDGRVVADDSLVEEPAPGREWAWSDLGLGYGSVAGALNYQENRFDVTIAPARTPGAPALISASAEGLDAVVNEVLTDIAGAEASIRPVLPAGSSRVRLVGSVPAGAAPATLSVAVANPTAWFATSLRRRLLAAGVEVDDAAYDADALPLPLDWREARLLHTHRSRPLRDLARPLMQESINLYGEAILRLATGPFGARSTAAALDAVHRRLDAWGVPAGAVQLLDGSGLSRRDVVSAGALATVLARMHAAPEASDWLASLPLAGREGTLRARLLGTPAEGVARAKSGTMSNIRSLAGYVPTGAGRAVSFAVVLNNHEGSPAEATAAIDRLVAEIAAIALEP